jgi:outer membrane protein OmpA-like peptidoglycan-associated protein
MSGRIKYLLIFLLLLNCNFSIAQTTVAGAITGPNRARKVIFNDDFSHDIPGKFPPHWQLVKRKDSSDVEGPKPLRVQNENGRCFLVNDNEPCLDKSQISIKPILITPLKTGDSTIMEFDFRFNSYCAIPFISSIYLRLSSIPSIRDTSDYFFELMNYRKTGLSLMTYSFKKFLNKHFDFPGDYNIATWHHFTVVCCRGNMKCYIDKFKTTIVDVSAYFPASFYLTMDGATSIANFSITATGNDFDPGKLLTQNKITTHAINFDINKSIIKPESMEFMRQLAQFLKANPAIKLEIDGHTDNDGDPEANLLLSLTRANEVKFKLIDLGIDEKRLSTKGFGATKPLQPNTTPEAKSNNRRVEFVKVQ